MYKWIYIAISILVVPTTVIAIEKNNDIAELENLLVDSKLQFNNKEINSILASFNKLQPDNKLLQYLRIAGIEPPGIVKTINGFSGVLWFGPNIINKFEYSYLKVPISGDVKSGWKFGKIKANTIFRPEGHKSWLIIEEPITLDEVQAVLKLLKSIVITPDIDEDVELNTPYYLTQDEFDNVYWFKLSAWGPIDLFPVDDELMKLSGKQIISVNSQKPGLNYSNPFVNISIAKLDDGLKIVGITRP